MVDYTYDENGVYFAYFLVSILSLILIPYSFRLFFSRTPPFLKASSCHCSLCQHNFKSIAKRTSSRNSSSRLLKALLLLVGWSLFGLLAYVIATTEIKAKEIWNPWEVLGVHEAATGTEIKKAYYKLSLIHHPDKLKDITGLDKANALFASIAKAYKTLTNPSLFKNFEEWGDPDGKQRFTLGIALPKWVVDSHSPYVLLLYGLVLGVILPYSIGRWWYKTRKYTKDGIRTETMAMFFKTLTMGMGLKDLLVVVCNAAEFQDRTWLSNAEQDQLHAHLEKRMGVEVLEVPSALRSPASQQVWYILMAHVFRVPLVGSHADVLLTTSFRLLQRGLLQIAMARSWLSSCLHLMDLQQCLTQALWEPFSPLLQIPHVHVDDVKKLRSLNVKGCQAFAELKDKSQVSSWSPTQIHDMELFLNEFPRIVLEKLNFKVIGEERITPGSLVTCLLKIRLISIAVPLAQVDEEYKNRKRGNPRKSKKVLSATGGGGGDGASNEDGALVPTEAGGEGEKETKKDKTHDAKALKQRGINGQAPLSEDEEEENDEEDEEVNALELEGEGDGANKRIRLVKKAKQVHAPYFPAPRYPGWWILIGNMATNRVIVAKKVHLDKKVIRIQFEAPNSTGYFPFSAFLKSEHWVGADMRLDIQMHVEEAKKKDVQIEDDISDPEEDSLAGQMAMLRGQRTKQRALAAGKKKKRVSSSDEEDEAEDDSSSDDE